MLSKEEKRFVRYWEEQRTGGKWSYILAYTIGFSVLLFFLPVAIVYILSMLHFFDLPQVPIWVVIILCLLTSFAGSQFFWHRNEEKWKLLTSK